jgi:hypothetical protein
MTSKAIRAAAVLLAALAIPAAVLVPALPASADIIGSMCETYGPYCLNTANFSPYTPVYESRNNARTIDAVLQNQSQRTYLLKFKNASSMCVASDNFGFKVEIKACSGSNGVIWTRVAGNGFSGWINNYAADHANGNGAYLTGPNDGSQYYLSGLMGGTGDLQVFTIS